MGSDGAVFKLFEGPGEVAAQAAAYVLARSREAVEARGRFRVVLAGGTTPLAAYRLLAGAQADWSAWEVYFGDERCLPPDHDERNSKAADVALLNQVPIPPERVHAMPAELGPESAAAAYVSLVREAIPFDLVILGVGEDGHTASLFPGDVIPDDDLVIPVHGAPKPPADRVSLAPEALTATRELLVLATGAGKREAVAAWRHGADLPIARVAMAANTTVFLDPAAAGSVAAGGPPGPAAPDDEAIRGPR